MPRVHSVYSRKTLRTSAASSGTSEQDDDVQLPETVRSFWVVVDKTAEFNADNVLTVRIQAKVESTYFDLSWDSMTTTGGLTVAADTATDVTRTPNVVDASSAATFTVLAYFKEVPSSTIRVVSVSSGTSPAHTFSVEALYRLQS